LGSAACESCHKEIYNRWRQTSMANGVRDPREHPAVPPKHPFDVERRSVETTFYSSDSFFSATKLPSGPPRATGDVRTFWRAFTNFLRAFTEPVPRIAFSNDAGIDALVSDISRALSRP
jgi:hypothetical protein